MIARKPIRLSERRQKAGRAAFTLIELLVVVAVITLLIAMLLPALGSARDQARSVKCLANMRDLGTASRTFAATHRGRFQVVTNEVGIASLRPEERSIYEYSIGDNLLKLADKEPMLWTAALVREASPSAVKRNRAYDSMNANRLAAMGMGGAGWGAPESGSGTKERYARTLAGQGAVRRFEQLVCPADRVEFGNPGYPTNKQTASDYWGYLSYSINEDITGYYTRAGEGMTWKEGRPKHGERLKGELDRVHRPSEVALYADGGRSTVAETRYSPNLMQTNTANGPLLEHVAASTPLRLPDLRHRKGSLNVTYVDGHGGFVRRVEAPGSTSDRVQLSYKPLTRISPYRTGVFGAVEVPR